MKNEFYDDYKNCVIPALQKQHGYKNVNQIPKVEKVVINTSIGSQSDVKQALEDAKAELTLITGYRSRRRRGRRRVSRTSSCARSRRSARRLRCVARTCMNSSNV